MVAATQTQQGARQASIRAVTGSSESYEGDWHRLFDLAGIPANDGYDGRLLRWLNLKLSRSYTNLPEAMQALATTYGAYNFSSLGTFDASTTPAAPVNTVAPAITGIRTQGQTLTSSTGTWTGSPLPTFAYQWKRGVTNIGTNSPTYVPVLADVGQSLTCVVTATNGSGSVPATSNAVTIAALLTISGTPGTTGTVGGAYSFTPTGAGGHTAYVYSLTGTIGASGLSFDTSTGALTASSLGPAATYGPYTITLTDADGLTASLTPFSIVVSAGGGILDFSDPNNSALIV